MKQNLADRNVVKLSDAKTLELKDEHWHLMSDLLPVLQPLGHEGGTWHRSQSMTGPHRRLRTIDTVGGGATKTSGGRVRGERDRGSKMAIGHRTTGRGITVPPSDATGQSVDVAGGLGT